MTNSFRWMLNKLGIRKDGGDGVVVGDDEPLNNKTSREKGSFNPKVKKMVESKLGETEDVWGHPEPVGVKICTYNVGEKLPNFCNHEPLKAWLQTPNTPPDIYAVGLQEVEMSMASILLEAPSSKGAIWAAFIETIIQEKSPYTALPPCSIGGLLLLVFVHEKHEVHSHAEAFVRIGYQGNLANKGAVAMRVSLLGRSMLFINSHLDAHENKDVERNKGYSTILKGLEFTEGCPGVGEVIGVCEGGGGGSGGGYVLNGIDYAFWFGDLNYRLRGVGGGRLDLQGLQRHDELKQMLVSGQAFEGWKEGEVLFPPTYKYEVGSEKYSHNRQPAWTDRILYHEQRPQNGISISVLPPTSHLLTNCCQPAVSPATESFYSCCFEKGGVSRRPSLATLPTPPASPPPEPFSLTNFLTLTNGSYMAYPATVSDHRPVSAVFTVGCVAADLPKAWECIRNDAEISEALGDGR